MSIFQPADDQETRAIVRSLVAIPGPVYLRLTRQKLVSVYSQPVQFQPGVWSVLREGSRVALLATGGLVGSCLEADDRLKQRMTIVNASSLKPIDEKLIHSLAETHDWIVTAEDHSVVGGLGSAVAEVLAETKGRARLQRFGVHTFGESGSPEDVLKHFQLDAEGIITQLKQKKIVS